MKQIWKYAFDTVSEFSLNMPKNSTILSLQAQSGVGCMWVAADPQAPNVERKFRTFETGARISDDFKGTFIGTYQVGSLVWHVFEVTA